MRFADVQALFTGGMRQWPNGAKIVLVERDAQSTVFKFLIERVLNTSPGEYRRRLISIEFAGQAPITPKILNSDAAACKFVFNVPGAISLIETSSLALPECGGVRPVRVDGKLPAEEGYRLR